MLFNRHSESCAFVVGQTASGIVVGGGCPGSPAFGLHLRCGMGGRLLKQTPVQIRLLRQNYQNHPVRRKAICVLFTKFPSFFVVKYPILH